MTSVPYNTLPPFPEFEDHYDRVLARDGLSTYRIHLGASDSQAADGTHLGDGDYKASELYRALTELLIKNDDPALDLASSILYTLEFEWT